MCKLNFILLLLQAIVMLPSALSASFNCSQPPNFSNFDVNSCCPIPEINMGDAPEKCVQYVNGLRKDKMQDYPAFAHVCYPECIYRETGSLINGQILMPNVRKFLQSSVHQRDKDFVPHIIKSFENCLQSINSHMQTQGIEQYSKLDDGCSPYASMVFGCVNADTFLHCPPKMWHNERSCNLAKSFAMQCNPLPHVPLPMM